MAEYMSVLNLTKAEVSFFPPITGKEPASEI
jgi:hypothetical protein